jgi:hypothetical protein
VGLHAGEHGTAVGACLDLHGHRGAGCGPRAAGARGELLALHDRLEPLLLLFRRAFSYQRVEHDVGADGRPRSDEPAQLLHQHGKIGQTELRAFHAAEVLGNEQREPTEVRRPSPPGPVDAIRVVLIAR